VCLDLLWVDGLLCCVASVACMLGRWEVCAPVWLRVLCLMVLCIGLSVSVSICSCITSARVLWFVASVSIGHNSVFVVL